MSVPLNSVAESGPYKASQMVRKRVEEMLAG